MIDYLLSHISLTPLKWVGLTYLMFVLFVAVMNVVRVYRAGKLTKTMFVLSLPMLGIGIGLDYFLNWTLCTAIYGEKPKRPLETISERLTRYYDTETGFKRNSAIYLDEQVIGAFDVKGYHLGTR